MVLEWLTRRMLDDAIGWRMKLMRSCGWKVSRMMASALLGVVLVVSPRHRGDVGLGGRLVGDGLGATAHADPVVAILDGEAAARIAQQVGGPDAPDRGVDDDGVVAHEVPDDRLVG